MGSEFTLFSPGEDSFQDPGMFESNLKAEAVRKGTHQSEMDQFYVGLNEQKREFDASLAFEGEKLAWEKEAFGSSLDLENRRLAFQESSFEISQEQFEKTFGLEQSRLDWEKERFGVESDFAQQQLGLEQFKASKEAGHFEKMDANQEMQMLLATIGIGIKGASLLFTGEKGGGLDLSPSEWFDDFDWDFGMDDYDWEGLPEINEYDDFDFDY